jgi:hypothetical protein
VISYSFWQRQFGGNANVIGTQLRVERVAFTIIGVTPPEFFGTDVGRTFDVAVPITAEERMRGRDTRPDIPIFFLRIMIRLKPGQSLDQATAALRSVQPQIRDAAMPTGAFALKVAADFLKVPFALQIAKARPRCCVNDTSDLCSSCLWWLALRRVSVLVGLGVMVASASAYGHTIRRDVAVQCQPMSPATREASRSASPCPAGLVVCRIS